MIIRQATAEDLKQVADVHIQCFPDSFSTQLGKAHGGFLQEKFYQEYYNDVPELFLVAEDDTLSEGRIIGFCMGYYLNKNDYMKNYLKHNLIQIVLRTLFLLLIGNGAAWEKLKSRFTKSGVFSVVNDDIKVVNEETGDLLSICVLPDYRGCGAAQMMIEKYQDVLRKNNKNVCLLTVAIENGRGVRFYERNGFVPYKEVADKVRTYAKIL